MDLMWVKTNRFVKWIFRKYIWDIKNSENKIYLTFDDGPIPEVTEWVLETLKQHEVKATFFCIGDNIKKHPAIFQKVIESGHSIGNHTFNHLKGWNSRKEEYIKNTLLCEEAINEKTKNLNLKTKIFRPPYGKIKPSQSKVLRKMGYKIIMWDVLSVDYDKEISPEQCLENIIKNTVPGSIIACHDSLKAFKNLEYALPKAIEYLKNKGFVFETIH
ncbi:polysaccharide deacetylase family protein [Flavobacterium macacae]|uniref:Polysaccharide deacetylase family protein n=1 Tax=Flavobacterium macacae TaxID=2488993 RepID=A0A3P3WBS0_9FLAO|nr:polysaccharide deacetylase family protein [Flavobacterium macacae]RRJ91767.1 polysaccharide deacetylase family protein [Flavobacterium macacae]